MNEVCARLALFGNRPTLWAPTACLSSSKAEARQCRGVGRMAAELYGKLLIVGKEGCADLEFPLDKKSILIGRCGGGRATQLSLACRAWP